MCWPTAAISQAGRSWPAKRWAWRPTSQSRSPPGPRPPAGFGKQDFIYLPEQDAYRCPAGEKLGWRFTSEEKGLTLHTYWTTVCAACPLKAQCTTGPWRRIKRWEHEAIIDAMQGRMDLAPRGMRTRRRTGEHPFGTIKAWAGSAHLLMKRLKNVRTEISLHVLAYNMKRVMAILGAKPLISAMQA